jgi:hypothetical protein
MTEDCWGLDHLPIVAFFFLTGIKSYTDESKNADPDKLQILTGLSM